MVSPNAIKKELDMFGIKPLLNGASWGGAVSDVINKANDLMAGELGLVEKMMQEAGFRRDERGDIPYLLTKLGVVYDDTRGDWVKLFKKANDPTNGTFALEALTRLFKVAQDWPQDIRTKMVSPNAIKKELDMFGIKPLLNGASWGVAVGNVINKANDLMAGELGLVEKVMQEAGFRRDERGEIPNLLTKLGVVNEDTRGDWVKLFKKANDPRESTSTSALEALTELFKVAQDWPQDVRTKMVSPNAIKKELDMFGIKPLLNGASWSIAVSDVINKAKDSAMKGGIDFNAANLNLQIKRDGNGVPLPISQQDLENINIDGLVPIIIDIQPAASLPIFSELQSH
jgi:hypothetical protein